MTGIEKIQDGMRMTTREQIGLTARLAFPAILAQLSSIMMQYIDAAMVGHLGADPSASVGLVSSSLWLFWGVCSMITMGFSVQVAHRIGAKEYTEARDVLRQGITVCLIAGCTIALIGLGISPWLPRWLGGNDAICHGASVYFAIFVAALPILTMNYLAGGMLRCAGNMKIPSMLNIGMCVMDVVFNFFLIFPTREIHLGPFSMPMPGAGLGITGAALGTVLAECLTAALMMYFLCARQRELDIAHRPRGSFRPTHTVMREAWKIGAPMTLEHGLYAGAQIGITAIVAPLGTVSIAANAFAVTAESLCYMPGYGIGDAATTLTGQSHGARRPELVRSFCHISVALGMAVMTVMGALMYIAAPAMMELMTDDTAISSLGAEMLRIEAWAEPMYAASIVCYGAFIGVGDTVLPAIFNFGSIWIVRIPAAAIMAPIFGLRGVWIAMAVELSVRGALFLWRMFSGRWLKKSASIAETQSS